MNNKNKIIDLFLWKEPKQKWKIKNQLGWLVRNLIDTYKNKNKKYPLSMDNINTLKNNEQWILLSFYDEYKNEIENIIIEYFIIDLQENIKDFFSKNKKYPLLLDIQKELKETLTQELHLNDKGFKLLMTEYIISEINTPPKNNKMRNLFKDKYQKNKELFKKFIFINLDTKKGIKYKEFEELWKKIKPLIQEVENDLLGHMEWWIHGDKSASVNEKFQHFISTIFPLYLQIWVKTKKLSKEEMEEYIKKMKKK